MESLSGREIERNGEVKRERGRIYKKKRESVCMCESERQREEERVSVCVCMCVKERE